MKNLRELLDRKLLSQPFGASIEHELGLDEARALAELYARLDNCISVLSDMKTRRSFVYYGAVADQLGMRQQEAEIDSIWEDQLFSRIHPDDLQRKFKLELQFFQYLTTLDTAARGDHEVITKLRVRNKVGTYMVFKHRLLYISSLPDGSAWLALCLYSAMPDHSGFSIPDGVIINKLTGTTIAADEDIAADILSVREKQVLQLIKHGYKSKEIAARLSLSINTINRHRQNIFEKLNADNALEACRIAEAMGILA
ncbi:response regulator transcription factor [Mucilaginibacter myungsuensis]|uniref:Helix-turn-helix transcriptional regulator n=1 Tax=Mucilaginibacter myungsuensis TaxID=649104 RepID=A0A929PVU7_9SPHI|nr:helix-turn-helix transcriptional regulator [Mucilaginibacter myungsuensis]MBE9661401.1 helix-turn-helix transcriptional regulator [Mucilaginibacter myungsuensis]MDN3597544.1 helix-turn-helix transcriptional regulator [Mucilaginibacter myungsuensis]